ncbi:hypothetical protein GALL_502420 [mine drainage metagenome]|uniref:Uncharacterized protein n=1 Tax=mine drainage metagenome TaxID=410659 RepID=A0A1J5PBQ9_9ZZZZ
MVSPAKASALARKGSPPRNSSGVRRTPSSTTPICSPSTIVRRSCCSAVASKPARPAAARSMSTVRYLTPSARAVSTSCVPCRPRSTSAMRCDSAPSSARSGPKTLTTRSPRAPVSISETRISIGWLKLKSTPGKRSTTLRIAAITVSLSPRHCSRGLSTRKVSVSFRPIGSRPRSSEPLREITARTSGTSASSARCSCTSSAAVLPRLTEAGFCSCTIRSPSSSTGMKVLPMRV